MKHLVFVGFCWVKNLECVFFGWVKVAFGCFWGPFSLSRVGDFASSEDMVLDCITAAWP